MFRRYVGKKFHILAPSTANVRSPQVTSFVFGTDSRREVEDLVVLDDLEGFKRSVI